MNKKVYQDQSGQQCKKSSVSNTDSKMVLQMLMASLKKKMLLFLLRPRLTKTLKIIYIKIDANYYNVKELLTT